MKWRFIDEESPNDGAQNMALDEIALRQMRAHDAPLLRFYRWNPACLSLGRFQKLASIPPNDGVFGRDLVRRPTGGRAVWHQHEITYCVVLPENLLPINERSVTASYRRISDGFLRGLQLLGINAQIAPAEITRNQSAFDEITRDEFAPDRNEETRVSRAAISQNTIFDEQNARLKSAANSVSHAQNEDGNRISSTRYAARRKLETPSNCFESATRADFVVDGRKLLGAAQCRRGGAILQHGSLLIDADENAWHQRAGGNMTGVVTLKSLGIEASRDEIIAALCAGIALSWDATLEKSAWNSTEIAMAQHLADEKYRGAAWNQNGIETETNV